MEANRLEEFSIPQLLDELRALRLEQSKLALHLLQSVLQVVPATGPCSFIRLNRFISERDSNRKPGRIFESEHLNAPPKLIVNAWLTASNFAANPIEQALYRKFAPYGLEYGATDYCRIFPPDEKERGKIWNHTAKGGKLFKLARDNGVKGLGYFWVRCAHDDLWLFSLRRKEGEPVFTDAEVAFLLEVARALYQARPYWYCRPLRWLTSIERQVIDALCDEDFETERASIKIGIQKKAYYVCQQRIYEKLNRRLGEGEGKIRSRVELLEFLERSCFDPQSFK